MRQRGRRLVAFATCAWLTAIGCESSTPDVLSGANESTADGAAPSSDATTTVTPTTPCVPGQSVACVGPGGCTTNQVCKADGSGFGSCDCTPPSGASSTLCIPGQSIECAGFGGCMSHQICNAAGTSYGTCDCVPPSDAGVQPLCLPGKSIACAGPGGCISSQVCNAIGTGYETCECDGDAGTFACIPGQSIACGGPFGCASYQVCNSTGDSYGSCDCPEGGVSYYDGGVPDGYAPLPPTVGEQGYNAIWVVSAALYEQRVLFLPLYSAADCNVLPPYGESYAVTFQPTSDGPSGTFPVCSQVEANPNPCYQPEPFLFSGMTDYETVPGGMYTLSAFNADGIATGQMNTTEGIVPLVVKNCE